MGNRGTRNTDFSMGAKRQQQQDARIRLRTWRLFVRRLNVHCLSEWVLFRFCLCQYGFSWGSPASFHRPKGGRWETFQVPLCLTLWSSCCHHFIAGNYFESLISVVQHLVFEKHSIIKLCCFWFDHFTAVTFSQKGKELNFKNPFFWQWTSSY